VNSPSLLTVYRLAGVKCGRQSCEGRVWDSLGTDLMILWDRVMGLDTLELVELVGFILFNFSHLKAGCLVYTSIAVSEEKWVLWRVVHPYRRSVSDVG